MAKFKVGDKVRVRKDLEVGELYGTFRCVPGMGVYRGQIVTVSKVDPSMDRYDITEDGGYWIWSGDMFELFQNDEITITRHGNKVVAKCGKKVGVAKCSPDDTFDFAVGAKLAFSRLMGEPEDKPEPKRKFKLGEFVKVIGNEEPLHNFPLGSIVAIMDLNDDKAVCYGLAEKFGRYSFCRQTLSLNDIEPLPENTHAN